MNHCRSVADACSDTASVGSATLSTVASSPTASTPSDSPASAHHFRAPTLCSPHDSHDTHHLSLSTPNLEATISLK